MAAKGWLMWDEEHVPSEYALMYEYPSTLESID
jgi:hypothetical protein